MKIKELRIRNNLSQTELAKIANTSQKTISNYENSEGTQNVEILIKLADYFHTTVDNLLDHEVPYLLDTSTLTDEQNELLEKIKQLSKENCQRVDAYITGLLVAEEEKQKILNFYNKGKQKWTT